MIEVNHLTKHYGNFTAVDDVSFTLEPGEILGFLGPNGAGKSTTMKMLTGFLIPSKGEIRICGCNIRDDRLMAQTHIGYLPEGAPAYDEMTPLGYLHFIGEARGLSRSKTQAALDRAIQLMSLEQVLDQRIETLSKGFKRRVGMAQAILHDPDVLILDEPTDGLDPNQKHQVREMIKGLSKDKIVIISTHILEEVTSVCNRVMVLANGSVVSDSTPQALMATSQYHGAIRLKLGQVDMGLVSSQLSALDSVKEVLVEADEMTLLPLELESNLLGDVMAFCQSAGLPVESIYREQGRLDEVFRDLTQGVSK